MTASEYTTDVGRRQKESPAGIAAWIRGVRESVGLNQDEFGARLRPEKPIHRVTITRWERGDMGQRAQSIALILKAFPKAAPPPLNGMSDPDRSVPAEDERGPEVTTIEGVTVGKELDEIENVELRKRARNAALAAIAEEKAKSHPSEPSATKSGSRARSS